jgi:hypothetical protein
MEDAMKSTLVAYVEDSLVHSRQEMDEFYDNRGMVVLLRAYALACGYIDVWDSPDGRMRVRLDMEHGTYRLRMETIDPDAPGLKVLDFYSRTFVAVRNRQKKYIAMLS